MALLGELAVNLVARTTKFEQGMRKGKHELNKFKQSTTATQKALGMLSKGLAGLAVGASLRKLTTEFFQVTEALESLGLAADKLGVATDKLRGFQIEAQKVGVETNALNTAMQRMGRRIGEALEGRGAALKTLEKLKLDATELVRLDAGEQMIKIAGAMETMGNQEEKLAAMAGIFDQEGVALVNLFSQGAESLRTAVDASAKLGPSDEDIKRAKEFNALWVDVTAQLGSLKEGVLISVAPDAIEFMRLWGGILQSDVTQALIDVWTTANIPTTFVRKMSDVHLRRAGLPDAGHLQRHGRRAVLGPSAAERQRARRDAEFQRDTPALVEGAFGVAPPTPGGFAGDLLGMGQPGLSQQEKELKVEQDDSFKRWQQQLLQESRRMNENQERFQQTLVARDLFGEPRQRIDP